MAVPFWRRDIRTLIPALRAGQSLPVKELAVFCRKMSILLDAGVPLKNAMPLVAAQSSAKLYKSALHDIRACIMRGDSLSAALYGAGIFPGFLCALVAVGEMSAQLPQVMDELALYYERQAKAEGELRAAMVYPAAVTSMMLAVMGVAVVYVLPNYAQVFAASDAPLPALTRGLFAVGLLLAGNPGWVLAALTGAAAVAVLFLKSNPADHMRLRLPLYRLMINLRFTQAMSIMLSSGQPLAAAVQSCAPVLRNKKAQRDMRAVIAGLSEGRAFWETLAGLRYMDGLLIGMLRVGEETGRLPQTMQKCWMYFDQAYQQRLSRAGKLVEPVITLLLGLLLGVMMLAIILPTFSLVEVV